MTYVLIERKFGAPTVCSDGVTIAKEMSLGDPSANMGVQIGESPSVHGGVVVDQMREGTGSAATTGPDHGMDRA